MKKFQLLWNSFFVQIFWNYHTMASVGTCYLLDKLLANSEIPKVIRLRLIIFFNGQPYLVPYAVSAIAKEIEEKTDPVKINRFIDSVVAMLGAVGDQYYWNSVKPVFLLLPCLIVLISPNLLIIAVVILLSLFAYNTIQIRERLLGFLEGKKLGFGVVKSIRDIKDRWGYLHFAKISFLIILTFSIIALIKYLESYPYIIFAILFIAWGMISSRRGNSIKYLVFAFLTYLMMEFFL